MKSKIARTVCGTCKVRIPLHIPLPICDICIESKHPKCVGLSKLEATAIIESRLPWTCRNCISDVLPIGAAAPIPKHLRETKAKFKKQCSSCFGWCYSPTSARTCGWCDSTVHKKCLNGTLGCESCCVNNIPGFRSTSFELLGSSSRTNNQIYNPYDKNYYVNVIGDALDDLKVDNDLWSEISDLLISCKYKQQLHIKPPKTDELRVLSLNIRSLRNKIDIIKEELDVYNNYDVICFCEASIQIEKLPNGISDIILDGFHEPFVLEPVRKSGRGGGLVIYVNTRVGDSDNIDVIDLDISSHDRSKFIGEFQAIRIRNCKGTNESKIIVNVYRSPSNKESEFITLIEAVLQKLERFSRKHVLLVGDFNIDLIKHKNDIHCQNLIDTASQHGFIQVASRPTRITDHSATLIDHVYTNNIEKTASCNIVTIDLSDHLATLTTISLEKVHERRNLKHSLGSNCQGNNNNRRLYGETCDTMFTTLIADEQWEDVFELSNASDKYTKFSEIYLKHYDTAYPINTKSRPRRRNERQAPKPWILPWLENACARKNRLYKVFVKEPTTDNKSTYKKMDDFCTKHCGIAKAKYRKKYFEQHKSNSKKQWEMINHLLNRKRKNDSMIRLQNDKGETLTSNVDIAKSFSDYFSNIATNIKSNINASTPSDPGGFNRHLNKPVSNSIFLNPTNAEEIGDIIKKFKNKATLDTKIDALKHASTSQNFLGVITQLVNSSLEEGVFPSELKIARVVPIHKAGNRRLVSNYRPISLLSTFSKIYEKIMHKRVLDFLDSNDSLFESQYGFRPGRSCEQALLNAQSSILNALSQKKVALLLLIDFSKAFDLVDHSILLKKLQHYGIRGVAHNWFKSYLENRQQFVTVNGTDSDYSSLLYGVPQGSILGPLLFIIYINDLPGINDLAKFILYADDANIIITGSSYDEVYAKVTDLSTHLKNWVNSNGLSLNLKKTTYMIFGGRARSLGTKDCPLLIDGTKIELTSEAKFLGVILDDRLTWASHISAVKAKMCRYLGIMFKLKRSLPKGPRLQIFHSFVQSHLNFCSLVWGFAAKTHIDTLFRKQKAGMRSVMDGFVVIRYTDGKLPSHTKSSFNEHGILSIQNLIVKNALIFMHKINYFPELLPKSIRELISEDRPTSSSTHTDSAGWLSKYSSTHYKKSLVYKGPLLSIQKINTELIESNPMYLVSPVIYKKAIKIALLKSQLLGDEDEWPPFLLSNLRGLRSSSRLEI